MVEIRKPLSLGVAHHSGHFAHFLLLGITLFRGRRKKSCPALDWRGKIYYIWR